MFLQHLLAYLIGHHHVGVQCTQKRKLFQDEVYSKPYLKKYREHILVCPRAPLCHGSTTT